MYTYSKYKVEESWSWSHGVGLVESESVFVFMADSEPESIFIFGEVGVYSAIFGGFRVYNFQLPGVRPESILC